MSDYPEIFRARQLFERPRVDDVREAVDAELAGLGLGGTIRPGQTVAVTAGVVEAFEDHHHGGAAHQPPELRRSDLPHPGFGAACVRGLQ